MTPKETHEQVQVGWLVVGEDGIGRFWPVDDKPEAMTYCEEAAEPVPVFCDKAALEKHNAEQEGK